MIIKKAQKLVAALFVTALFAVGCNEGTQMQDTEDTRNRNETANPRGQTPPDGVDRERTTPVNEEAAGEVETGTRMDTNNRRNR